MTRLASLLVAFAMVVPMAGCFVRTRRTCGRGEYWDGSYCRAERDRHHDHDRHDDHIRDHRN